ncbi:UNVERIFIED_CONTAM: putative sucrose-phosphate synthase 1 [Sesamum calycinum]|uniref:Sucrose-phosphate synthase 1 n=1 Tax=Sesamum calycinum TaxID=2727403 RepID=A0AAW2RS78_9LAMI
MAGNDWINSYLEAILDVGPGIDEVKSSLLLRERGRFSPTRYFVEEVITGFDETDLHRSWVRAQATRSPQERNTRLENMCWRIWNLARQKKQVKYVVELARALASMPGVYRVDLLTRQVSSPEVDWSYGEPTEMLPPRNSESLIDEMGESSGAYIIRIPFGPKDKYVPKELLWPHIPEFVDGALGHIIQMSKVLGEQIGDGHPVWPVAIHGHYADAGDSAALLSGSLNVPMLFTGHSLGRDKLEQLLRQGRLSRDEIDSTYKIMRRIEAEELSLDASEIVITSTRQEIEEQWRLYDGFDPILERKLRARIKRNVSCYGRFMPRMATLIMGNRDNIDEMSGTNASVLLSILKLIDKYDLYGQVAYPKHHKQNDVPEIYRLAAKTKVLDNGLLVDPHDQQSVADALLKLVADKHLWAKCRANGLKNIHLFSWPEHCKTYLSRIASCKPRQPRWLRNDDDDENSESDSPSDSLRDIQDISLNLKFSFEGDKNESRDNFDGSLDSEDRRSKLENAVLTWSKGVARSAQKSGSTDKGDQNSNAGKFPALRRRKHIFVIAVDTDPSAGLSESVRKIFEAVKEERAEGSVGFILATSFNITETQDNPFVVDLYYHSHIEYRWGGEGLRKTLVRWAASTIDKRGEKEEHIVVEDEETSADYCYSFKVQKPGVVPPIKELRKLMRIQALRCHVIHCQNGRKINVIPVLASRSQALRYLYLRWGMDLSKVVVFVGESGDTDYEGLLGGVHKSVVLTGVCSSASSQLHANRNYPLTDVVFYDSPNIIRTTEGCNSSDLRASLEESQILKG